MSTPLRRLALLLAVTIGLTAARAADPDPKGGPAEFKELKFRSIGPAAGGRTCRSAGVPGDPLTYYTATAGGGVWESSDGGVVWKPIFDDHTVSSIGSLAVAPSDPNVIYIGSGEANIRGNVSAGNGIYKSVDAGKTWKHIWKQEGQIGTMIVHPANADIAYAAVLGKPFGPNPERGVYRTTDGGVNWKQVLAKDADTGEEGWYIELNTDALPKVLVDRNYHATLMKGARAKPDRDFVAERFQSANWLVKTLEQRATTILKVAREIVRQQDAFFRKGVSALKPLVLRDIAIATGLHESTVSRVTSNKYIATPRGIFELKYFFTSALPGRAPGAVVSSESVRSRIRHLVDGEGSAQPLSDDRIVDLLKGEGVDIARRTVAKYREAMRIPSSAERRRLGRLGMGRSLPSGVPSAAVAAQALAGPAD